MTRPRLFAVEGRIGALTAQAERVLLERGRPATDAVSARVATLIEEVRRQGDVALLRFARDFDGVDNAVLEVPMAAAFAALDALDPAVRSALDFARDAIEAFHVAQLPATQEIEVRPGVRLGRRPDPLRCVGVYAPGGLASYPSSVLMGVVPAKVAGVGSVMVCSPPGADGRPPAPVLAACALAGADRIFSIGGAGAMAALAFGTETVPRADRVVGPGNAYVTEAKRQLAGVVAIDCPAGPSEVLILADDSADAQLLAAELVAQAEHDPQAAAVLVATDTKLLVATRHAIAALLADQPRSAIVREAFAARGALLHAPDLDAALRFAERYAPEHLMLAIRSPHSSLERVRAAGTVFIGAHSSVVFGDYVTGANHVLPTAGLTRGYSGLSTADFFRWTTWQEVDAAAAALLAAPACALAEAEGLPGHAFAALLHAPPSSVVERLGGSANEPLRSLAMPRRANDTNGPRLRPAYAALEPYDPGRAPCPIDLSDNTNLFGVAPAAAEVLRTAPPSLVTRYPSPYATQLKRALAERFGVAPDNVTTGCGSDDVIDATVRAFCEAGDAFAFPWPTFGVVPMFAQMNGAAPIAVPLRADFELDVDPLLAARARVTYVCRPNNPTGNAFDRSEVERLARTTAGLVLVDEAYADFAEDDLITFACASDRLVVLRTLSKANGMAGLRVGFAIGAAPLIREIEKSRGPYKVGALAEAAAVAVLHHDAAWVRAGIAQVRENRDRLAAALQQLGVHAFPSAANFLLLPVPAVLGTAALLCDQLRAGGVAVRPFPTLPGAGDCIRVTVGPWPLMQSFLDVLGRLLGRASGRARASVEL